ncbi:MAG TPA: MltA domain-containing protein [Rickettsiales bacterium]|nr:MltA domain-containing protein [Rickettsiales bacterium]
MLLLLFLMTGCEPNTHGSAQETMTLSRIDFRDIAGWNEDNHVEAFVAFMGSCDALMNRSDTDAIGKNTFLAPAVVWKNICRKASLVNGADETSARQFFENEFIPMRVGSNRSNRASLTGYYEPLLNGSRTPEAPFLYPIYAMPPGGTTYSRQQIDSGYLRNQAGVIAFVDDPVQLFFMQIQGSGSIQLRDGQIIHVGYAGSNGQPYVAIGRYLVQKGLINKQGVSMQVIRQWLYDHPESMWQTMWQNPSYIFFQEVNGGPYGTQQVALTPGRSLAVDQNYIPLGMPVFVDTVLPGTEGYPFLVSRSLMIAQDTGSAIRGPLRGDIFFGSGYAAEQLAGRMQSGGDFTVLVPRILAKADNESMIKTIGTIPHYNPQPADNGQDNSSVQGLLNAHQPADNNGQGETLESWFSSKRSSGSQEEGDTLESWMSRRRSGNDSQNSNNQETPSQDAIPQDNNSQGNTENQPGTLETWWKNLGSGSSQSQQEDSGDTLSDYFKRRGF